ncbi:hypothetical protein AYI69_g1298, partial [Smittium culicis]
MENTKNSNSGLRRTTRRSSNSATVPNSSQTQSRQRSR